MPPPKEKPTLGAEGAEPKGLEKLDVPFTPNGDEEKLVVPVEPKREKDDFMA